MSEIVGPMRKPLFFPSTDLSDSERSSSDDDDDYESSEDERELYELSDEELWTMINHHPHMGLNKDRIMAKLDVVRSYLREVEESEGFEINHFPGKMMGITSVIPSQYAGCFLESDEAYKDLAEWAIEYYNDNNETYYGDVQVVQVNLFSSGYRTYYITFTAIEDEDDDDDDESNADGSDCETEEDNESEAVRSSETDVVGSNVTGAGETESGGSDETDDVGSNVTGAGETEAGGSDETGGLGSNVSGAAEAEAEAGGSDQTDGVGSNVIGETEAGGSDKTDGVGSNAIGETEAGGSDKTDDVGCKDRKTFEARLSVCFIGGKHDPVVKMCRFKAPQTNGVGSNAISETEAGGTDKTDGVGSIAIGETEAGGSDKTDGVGSNAIGETEAGGSDKTDAVGCKERKTFEARLCVNFIGGKHDPEVEMCRLKAPRSKEVSQSN